MTRVDIEVTTKDLNRLVKDAIAASNGDRAKLESYIVENLPAIVREVAA